MRFKVIFLFLAIGLVLTQISWAKESRSPQDWSQLQPLCREQWNLLPTEKWNREPEPVGIAKYVLTSRLIATQPEFAYYKYLDSEEKHLERHKVTWDNESRRFVFSNQRRKQSLYPMTSAIQVVSYRGELYIIDGHHRALLSVCKGSPMVPVKIRFDLSHLNRNAFMLALKELEKEEEIYLHYRNGEPVFINPTEMEDNRFLYLARQITRTVDFDERKQTVLKMAGADAFLILKINRGEPGQEFDIAPIAEKVLPNYVAGQNLSKRELELLGNALGGAKWSQYRERIVVFSTPQTLDKKDTQKLVRRHTKSVAKAACRKDLSDAK